MALQYAICIQKKKQINVTEVVEEGFIIIGKTNVTNNMRAMNDGETKMEQEVYVKFIIRMQDLVTPTL